MFVVYRVFLYIRHPPDLKNLRVLLRLWLDGSFKVTNTRNNPFESKQACLSPRMARASAGGLIFGGGLGAWGRGVGVVLKGPCLDPHRSNPTFLQLDLFAGVRSQH